MLSQSRAHSLLQKDVDIARKQTKVVRYIAQLIGLENGLGPKIVLKANQLVSTEFRPLGTRAICALELRDLDPTDTLVGF